MHIKKDLHGSSFCSHLTRAEGRLWVLRAAHESQNGHFNPGSILAVALLLIQVPLFHNAVGM